MNKQFIATLFAKTLLHLAAQQRLYTDTVQELTLYNVYHDSIVFGYDVNEKVWTKTAMEPSNDYREPDFIPVKRSFNPTLSDIMELFDYQQIEENEVLNACNTYYESTK